MLITIIIESVIIVLLLIFIGGYHVAVLEQEEDAKISKVTLTGDERIKYLIDSTLRFIFEETTHEQVQMTYSELHRNIEAVHDSTSLSLMNLRSYLIRNIGVVKHLSSYTSIKIKFSHESIIESSSRGRVYNFKREDFILNKSEKK